MTKAEHFPPSGRRRAGIAVALAASVAWAVHATFFAGWIVDDAGISFSYARSLATGNGLVAQPGAAPVEGFTNLTWVLLLAAGRFVTGAPFEVIARTLAALAIVATFVVFARLLLAGERRDAFAVSLALVATASATPFTAWSVSGLENPLFALAIVLALERTVRTAGALAAGDQRVSRSAVETGAMLALVATTRPDGLLFLVAPPLVWAAVAPAEQDAPALRRAVAGWGIGFALPWALVTVGRLLYFGDVLPNTYYAKHGSGWREVSTLLDRLGRGAGGALILAAMLAAVALVGIFARHLGRRLGRRRSLPTLETTLVAFTAIAALVPLALPSDWMPEWRFATPLVLLTPAASTLLVGRLAPRPAGLVVAAVSLMAALVYSTVHTPRFAAAPTIPFSAVRKLARDLDTAASAGGLARPRVLLPDIGGALWENRFEVVDLAGLVDRAIARLPRRDRVVVSRELLDVRRPELVWTHGFWSKLYDWERLPGFAERYVRVWSEASSGGEVPAAALYLRRDLAAAEERVAAAFAAAR